MQRNLCLLAAISLVSCSDGPSSAEMGSAGTTESTGLSYSGVSGDDDSGSGSGSGSGSTAEPTCDLACPEGQVCEDDGAGERCVDVDECADDPCPPGEVCTNLDPGYRCEGVMPPVSGCGFDEAAFCEDFETPAPGGRGGDIDETRWGVSRWTHDGGNAFYRELATSENDTGQPDNPANGEATFCGAPFSDVGIADDMRICDGDAAEGGSTNQLHEVGHDTGDFLLTSMMIRQPFDFAGRTGTIVFDVDAKHNVDDGGHGWWIEVFVAEDPVPLVYQEAPSLDTQPRNGIGFEFVSNGTSCNETGHNILSNVLVLRDWEVYGSYTSGDHYERVCFEATDQTPNRFEIRLARDHAEVWVSDASTPTDVRRIAELPGIDLNFERGYVTLHHVGYNAIKDAALPSQTYRWDNVGFDGPRLSPLRAYDIPNNAGQDFGYEVPAGDSRAFEIDGVDVEDAEQAWFNLNYVNYNLGTDATIEFRVNQNAWHPIADYIVGPNPSRSSSTVRAFSAPLDLTELQPGTNEVEVRGGGDEVEVANMDLALR